MKNYIFTILIMVTGIFMSSAQEIDKGALRMAIERQLASYPESTLQDIYKAFYQEHFGPEHMIDDTAAVRQYLDYELSTMGDECGGFYYEAIGARGDYVRVSLKCVKHGLISADELLQAFLDSAAARQVPAVEWSCMWDAVVQAVDEVKPGLGSAAEREALREASIKKQAVHHSKAYNEAYHPHYRIVHHTIFEMLLKPTIDMFQRSVRVRLELKSMPRIPE